MSKSRKALTIAVIGGLHIAGSAYLAGPAAASDGLTNEAPVERAGISVAAGPRPLFQLPFACGDKWQLTTYAGHDDYDIDMFRVPRSTTPNQPILASFGGTVVKATFDDGGGHHVRIDHGNGWQTLYLHMVDTPLVKRGDTVAQGQELGRVGKTGATRVEHLHYEQLRDGAKTEAWFNGVPSGITDDNTSPPRVVESHNCPGRPSPVRSAASGVVVDGGGYLHVFARTTDRQLVQWYAPAGGSYSLNNLGGDLAGNPVTALDANGYQHVFAVGTDTTLKHWWAPAGGSWTASSLPGSYTGSPTTAVDANGYQHIFATGSNGRLQHWWAPAGGTWTGAHDMGNPTIIA